MQNQADLSLSSKSKWLTFILPSLLGVFLFMAPITQFDADSGKNIITIPIAILAKGFLSFFDGAAPAMVTGIVCFSALMSVINRVAKPAFIGRSDFLNHLFSPSTPWFIVQLLGAFFVTVTFLHSGDVADNASILQVTLATIASGDTGGLVLHDLMPTLLSVFIFAGLLLPLLMNFGLLEFVGALFTRVMQPIFKLPGRSAVNCIASWLGDGSVGVLLTSKQYEDGLYTQREAAVIGTTFSAVSITFSLVVLTQVSLQHLFMPFYLTVCVAGLAAAIIIPRLPPLSNKKDTYINGDSQKIDFEAIPEGQSVIGTGLEKALEKASQVKSARSVINEGVKNAMDMVLGVLPVVMAIGTIALVIAETTPLFNWLGAPFEPFLRLLQIPEAAEASKTIVVGFADMFLPSILATGIESDLTRFVIAAMSVTQLIYMSEIGALLIGSKIPVKLWELFIIFILRTLITLPVIALMAHGMAAIGLL
ncbi:YjiH family protein [Thaumasiovibrio subtropicus]|uniref:YjiH family protein n=1 Tax=Thaumasiovibrio subtropicus TaxID=1891207 RepID=UPI000B35D6CB|nr:YjiH family protein [Thaumasiovibrio subtropicus]